MQDIASARESAREIIRRVVQDEDVTDRLRQDPHTTLPAAGFPSWAVNDFVTHDLGMEPEVGGYAIDACAITSFIWIDEDGITSN